MTTPALPLRGVGEGRTHSPLFAVVVVVAAAAAVVVVVVIVVVVVGFCCCLFCIFVFVVVSWRRDNNESSFQFNSIQFKLICICARKSPYAHPRC